MKNPDPATIENAPEHAILPRNVPNLRVLLADFAGAAKTHASLFLDLLAASENGHILRKQFHETAFAGLDSRSAISRQTELGKAFSAAAQARNFTLRLVVPQGRASATSTLSLAYAGILPVAASLNDSGTREAAEFIGEQHTIAPRARPQIKRLAVCYAKTDEPLWEKLQEELHAHLKAHRNSQINDLTIWTPHTTPGGSNDSETMQQQLSDPGSAALLCVSTYACADPKIWAEWRQFRNEQGLVLRPFVAIKFGHIDSDTNLHALKQVENRGATVLTSLTDADKEWSWSECVNNDQLRQKFVTRLVTDIEQQFFRSEAEIPTPPQRHLHTGDDIAFCKTSPVPATGAKTPLNETWVAQQEPGGVLIVPALREWVCNPHASPFAALLGEYGTGKTWTCQLLSKALHDARMQGEAVPEPFYFDLRKLTAEQARAAFSVEKTVEAQPPRSALQNLLRTLIVHSTTVGHTPTPEKDIIDAVQNQGALIIFDGLDEVMVHHDEQWGVNFVRTLFSILPYSHWPQHLNPNSQSPQPGKVLASCRSHYFKSLQEMQQQLLEQGRGQRRGQSTDGKTDMSAWTMLPLNEVQILQYLHNNIPGRDPQQLLELLKSVHNLTEICGRFIGISHVVQQIDALEQARQRGEQVNAASIYKGMLEKWIERDKGKHRILAEDKPRLMQALAWTLWQQGRTSIPWSQLQDWFRHWLRQDEHYRHQTIPHTELATWLEDLRTATFIVRPDAEAFAFAHTSILEYCLAAQLYQSLQTGEAATTWDLPTISAETLEFIVQLHELADGYNVQQALSGLQGLLAAISATPINARQLALDFFLTLNRATPPGKPRMQLADAVQVLNLDGMDCANRHFTHLRLRRLSVKGTRLYSSRWLAVQCHEADFSDAGISDSVWEGCRVKTSVWHDTDIRNSYWKDCNLEQVQAWEEAKKSEIKEACLFVNGKPFRQTPVPAPSLTEANYILPHQYRLSTNAGHSQSIVGSAIAYAPDGAARIVTASNDKTAKIWDEHGACLATLSGHTDSLRSCAIAYAPGGAARIVTSSYDNTAKIWNEHGACLATLPGHTSLLTSCAIAYAPGGAARIVTASYDKTAKIWNEHGACLATLSGHTSLLTSCAIAYAPDGAARIVTASDDNTAKIWDEHGACLATLSGHTSLLTSCAIAYAPDGAARIVTASYDKTAKIWDEHGACLATLKGHTRLLTSCAIAYAPGGAARIVTSSHDNTAKIWDEHGACLATLSGHTDSLRSCAIAYAPGGAARIVTASRDNTAKIWDEHGAFLATLKGHTSLFFTSCAIAYAPGGAARIVTASDDNTAKIWDEHGACLATLSGHTDSLRSCTIAYAPGGAARIVTSSHDNTAKIWDEHGACLATLSGHTRLFFTSCAIAYAPDGAARIVTTSSDNTAKIWDEHGACLATLSGHTSLLTSCAIAYAPGGAARIVTSSHDNTAKIWDEHGACLATLSGHTSLLTSCAIVYAPGGAPRIVTASKDKTAKIWDEHGACLATLKGHTSWLTSCAIAYAPGGAARIVTASDDNTAKIWDEHGACLATLSGHTSLLTSCAIAYAPDGAPRIVTASHDDSTLLSQLSATNQAIPTLRLSWNATMNLQATDWKNFIRAEPGSPYWKHLILEELNTDGNVSQRYLADGVLRDWPPEALALVKNFPDGWWA